MQGASGATAGITLIAGMLTALSLARAAEPAPRGANVRHPPTGSREQRSRERYRESIQAATEPNMALQLARSFEMAGYVDLAEDARNKAEVLQQQQVQQLAASAPPPAPAEAV